ncbi:formylglycine-generating enzyme family protein [Salibacterium aidingense]|uniref:formylglycine-generating enzyme family protein n=1 Tax=Salibacterium aidingense TaxID=384933 RepID=UPI00041CC8D8|nr:formylglycine-generating enzyme family protein [Salibacterium aidingense]
MKETNEIKPCCAASRSNFQEEKTPAEKATVSSGSAFQEKLIYIPGGEFWMGTEDEEGFPGDGEGPVRKVQVKPFYMDAHTVTNAEFDAFVRDTGYVTEAEQYRWSFVFHHFISKQAGQVQQLPDTPWWYGVDEAFWYQPEGPGSTIEDRMDHPVTHVSWNDAEAFSKWAGKRLPTEAEWEYAARGGLEQNRYPWGNELTPGGEYYCNIWQGKFPFENTKEDGYASTAPSVSFPPNGYGLYNVSGNVWEWCSDYFSTNPSPASDQDTPMVIRGGSYLCHHSYCNRYRVAARSMNTKDSSTGNMGFRCAADV